MCAVLQPQGAVLGRELQFNFMVLDGSASSKMITNNPISLLFVMRFGYW